MADKHSVRRALLLSSVLAILVARAWSQQVQAPTRVTMTTSGWQPPCNDFPAIVNFETVGQMHARVSWNQGVQIDNRSAVFPQESVV